MFWNILFKFYFFCIIFYLFIHIDQEAKAATAKRPPTGREVHYCRFTATIERWTREGWIHATFASHTPPVRGRKHEKNLFLLLRKIWDFFYWIFIRLYNVRSCLKNIVKFFFSLKKFGWIKFSFSLEFFFNIETEVQ